MVLRLEVKGLLKSRQEAARIESFLMRAIDMATKQEAHLLRSDMVNGLRDQRPGGGQNILPLSEMTILLRGLPRSGGGKGSKKKKVRKGNFRDSAGRLRDRYGKYIAKGGKSKRGSKRRKTPKRGHSKALIDRGDLMGSINVRSVSWAHYTVGVHRGERGKRGSGDMVNIAEIHEGGTKSYTVTVTAKMVKFSKFLVVMGILNAPWRQGQTLRRKIPARPFMGPAHESWEINSRERFELRLDVFLRSGV